MQHTPMPHLGCAAETSLANQRYGLHPNAGHAHAQPAPGPRGHHAVRYLLLERPEIALHESNGDARLVITPIIDKGPNATFWAEFIAVAMMQMMRYASANSIRVAKVRFAHPAPPYQSTYCMYCTYFDAGIDFNTPDNAIILNRDILDQPLPWHDRVSYLEA